LPSPKTTKTKGRPALLAGDRPRGRLHARRAGGADGRRRPARRARPPPPADRNGGAVAAGGRGRFRRRRGRWGALTDTGCFACCANSCNQMRVHHIKTAGEVFTRVLFFIDCTLKEEEETTHRARQGCARGTPQKVSQQHTAGALCGMLRPGEEGKATSRRGCCAAHESTSTAASLRLPDPHRPEATRKRWECPPRKLLLLLLRPLPPLHGAKREPRRIPKRI
jgi:hypothetical protein